MTELLKFELEPTFDLILDLKIDDPWLTDEHRKELRLKYLNFYYSYAKSWRPTRLLEIGVRYGYSMLAMGLGAGNCLKEIVGIDSEQDIPGSNKVAEAIIKRHLPDVETSFYKIDTQVQPVPPVGKFDLIHLDANHYAQGVVNDFAIAVQILEKGGRIIIDDLDAPEPQRALKRILQTYNFDCVIISNFRDQALLAFSGG